MQEKNPSFEAAVESIKQALEKVCVFFCCVFVFGFFLPGEKEAKGKGMVSSHGLLLLVVSFSVVLLFLRPSRATRA